MKASTIKHRPWLPYLGLDKCAVDPDFDDFDCGDMWAHSVATVGTVSLDPVAWHDCDDHCVPAGRRATPDTDTGDKNG